MENNCTKEELELVEDAAATNIRKLKEREEGNEQAKGKDADFLSLHVSRQIFFFTTIHPDRKSPCSSRYLILQS